MRGETELQRARQESASDRVGIMLSGSRQTATDDGRGSFRQILDAKEIDVALGANIHFTDTDADAIRKHGHILHRRFGRHFAGHRHVSRAQRQLARLRFCYSTGRLRLSGGLSGRIGARLSRLRLCIGLRGRVGARLGCIGLRCSVSGFRFGFRFASPGFRFTGSGFRSLKLLSTAFSFGLLAGFDLVVLGLRNSALSLQQVEQSVRRIVGANLRRCGDASRKRACGAQRC